MKTELLMRKIDFLRGAINPDTVDGNPGQPGPVFRPAVADYIVAELLRDVSANLEDRSLAPGLLTVARELAASSANGLVASLDAGDEICPPWFRVPVGGPPKHGPGPDPFLGPEPSPWWQQLTPAMNDIILAHALQQLASLTTNEHASAAMKQAGQTIVKDASGELFDEYCGTIVKPRVPAPKTTSASA